MERAVGLSDAKEAGPWIGKDKERDTMSAEEMRESANTVREAGFAPIMTAAIADKQQWVADQAKAGVFTGLGKDACWQDYADRLLQKTGNSN